ncbi:hypothetical protein GCE9029_01185 [Grimontia celer]|uniref:Uncharacterized protein n=1 Tax=Grimontia celer TaxID=1796497 RepID=A0A128EXV1_9GAMM|nr:hypothetical protein [Grimontia celer]CZF78990.1 hypothetical protein GCE9029_01185 [Grimontia celer]
METIIIIILVAIGLYAWVKAAKTTDGNNDIPLSYNHFDFKEPVNPDRFAHVVIERAEPRKVEYRYPYLTEGHWRSEFACTCCGKDKTARHKRMIIKYQEDDNWHDLCIHCARDLDKKHRLRFF